MRTRPVFDLGCGRGSTIWHVSPAAQFCETSPRVLQLACPKTCNSEFKYNKEPSRWLTYATTGMLSVLLVHRNEMLKCEVDRFQLPRIYVQRPDQGPQTPLPAQIAPHPVLDASVVSS
ncbi:UNVERIFIED_CONTAM: hypothetical protein FKN15_069511 [Acipenser sinensis]